MFKKYWPDIKIVLLVFVITIILLFVLFSFDAIYSIVSYKLRSSINNFEYDLKRPITFKSNLERPINNSMGQLPTITIPSQASMVINKLSDLLNQATATTKPKIVIPIPSESIDTNLIGIPKFNIKAPITNVAVENKTIIYAALKKGVIVYPTTDIPGGKYTIILGHSSRYPGEPGKYKSVFSLLNELTIGDTFYIYGENKPMAFRVEDKKIFLPYPKGEYTTESIFSPNSSEKILILQSCGPVGVNYKRIAIKSVLISE